MPAQHIPYTLPYSRKHRCTESTHSSCQIKHCCGGRVRACVCHGAACLASTRLLAACIQCLSNALIHAEVSVPNATLCASCR